MIVFTSKIIRIAFELFDYIDSIDRIYFFNTSTKITVNNIVINYFKSTSLSIISHSISINTVYFVDWIVDKIRFRRNIKNFVIATEIYRNNQQFFDWISVNFTSIISDSNSSIANIFRFKFFDHFFDELNDKFQIISFVEIQFSQMCSTNVAIKIQLI